MDFHYILCQISELKAIKLTCPNLHHLYSCIHPCTYLEELKYEICVRNSTFSNFYTYRWCLAPWLLKRKSPKWQKASSLWCCFCFQKENENFAMFTGSFIHFQITYSVSYLIIPKLQCSSIVVVLHLAICDLRHD